MHIHLSKRNTGPRHKKDGRINPHRFWIIFISLFVLALIAEIVFFTFFFIVSSQRLDAPVVPQLETNSAQIRRIENTIKNTEDAVSTRTSQTTTSEQ